MNHPSRGICMYLCALQHNTVSAYWVQSQSEENEPCQCSVRGHNAVTEGLRLRPLSRLEVSAAGAMQIRCQLVRRGKQTCRAMLGHSAPSLGGSTFSEGNFAEPVLFQLERWDFTLHQPHDREAPRLHVRTRAFVCGCVGKDGGKMKKKSSGGIRHLICQTSWGQNAYLSTWRHEQNSFTVTLVATTGREFPFQDNAHKHSHTCSRSRQVQTIHLLFRWDNTETTLGKVTLFDWVRLDICGSTCNLQKCSSFLMRFISAYF